MSSDTSSSVSPESRSFFSTSIPEDGRRSLGRISRAGLTAELLRLDADAVLVRVLSNLHEQAATMMLWSLLTCPGRSQVLSVTILTVMLLMDVGVQADSR